MNRRYHQFHFHVAVILTTLVLGCGASSTDGEQKLIFSRDDSSPSSTQTSADEPTEPTATERTEADLDTGQHETTSELDDNPQPPEDNNSEAIDDDSQTELEPEDDTSTEESPIDESDDPCRGLDYLGQCNGGVSEWCDRDGELKQVDCAARGQSCGWVDDQTGWYCGGNPNGGPDDVSNDTDPTPDDSTNSTSNPCGSDTETEVVRLANESRVEEGLGTLECDANMTLAARIHSQDMCDQGYFSHTSLDGRTPWDRMREQGVSFGRGAENIARGQGSPASVHSSWMNSPGHRANLLGRGLRRIGVGFVNCNGARYWTQVFAD